MAYEFKLPDLGEGLTEGEVARWLVSEGDEVAEDQPLVEIQTDKTTVEIPSPAAGKVAQILVEEGSVVPVGTMLVVIGEDGARPGARQRAAQADRSRARHRDAPRGTCPGDAARPSARPGAQRRSRALTGTGPQGRVTEADVRGAAGSVARSRDKSGRDGGSRFEGCAA